MVSIINRPSGITLFTKVFEGFYEKTDTTLCSELIGSFISAIRQFSTELGQNKIKLIEMNDLKFMMHEKDNTLIFFLVDNRDSISKYKKSLVSCLKAFLLLYPENSIKEVKNIKRFQNFHKVINNLLEPSNFINFEKKNEYKQQLLST